MKKLQLVDGWEKWYRMYSIWAFAILALIPDLYNLAVQYDLVSSEAAPVQLARIINMIAFAGAASRLIKQKQLELEAAESKPDDSSAA